MGFVEGYLRPSPKHIPVAKSLPTAFGESKQRSPDGAQRNPGSSEPRHSRIPLRRIRDTCFNPTKSS